MTNPNRVDLHILLDRSGSMSKIMDDMIGGINTIIEENKKMALAKGLTTMFSLRALDEDGFSRKFTSNVKPTVNHVDNNRYENIVEEIIPYQNIFNVAPLTKNTISTRGATPLIDAYCLAVDSIGSVYSRMAENERPSKVMLIVITDGEENASTVFKSYDASMRTQVQKDIYKWEITYMGANQDAWAQASTMGIGGSVAVNYVASPVGVKNMMRAASYLSANHLGGNFTGCIGTAFNASMSENLTQQEIEDMIKKSAK